MERIHYLNGYYPGDVLTNQCFFFVETDSLFGRKDERQ